MTVNGSALSGPVTVTNAGGSTASVDSFSVLPKITGFSPTSGGVGTLVTINGSGLAGTVDVQFTGHAVKVAQLVLAPLGDRIWWLCERGDLRRANVRRGAMQLSAVARRSVTFLFQQAGKAFADRRVVLDHHDGLGTHPRARHRGGTPTGGH